MSTLRKTTNTPEPGQRIDMLLCQSDTTPSPTAEQYHILLSCAFKILRSPEDAQDTVRDALHYARKHIFQLKNRDSLYSWLYSIVANHAKNQLRIKLHNRKFISLLSDFYNNTSEPSLPASKKWQPEYPIIRREYHRLLAKTLKQLSQHSRLIVLLRFQYGYSYRQISDLLNCPIGTVKSQLSRTRKRLINELKQNLMSDSRKNQLF